MMRAVLGVIVGYAVWTALWLAGNALVFGAAAEAVRAERAYTAAGPLLGILALSVVCSLAAGWTCAMLSRRMRAVVILGALLLLTGIGVQIGAWDVLPVWYHLAFLVLLVPMTVLGGTLVKAKGASAP